MKIRDVMSKRLEGVDVRKEWIWMLDRQTRRTSEREVENSVLLSLDTDTDSSGGDEGKGKCFLVEGVRGTGSIW